MTIYSLYEIIRSKISTFLHRNILKACFIFLVFELSSLFIYGQQIDSNFHIYILAGQSNMAGRGAITDGYQKVHNLRVLSLGSDLTWKVAKHPIHFDKPAVAGVGPGLDFGIAMAEQSSQDIKIGLVPCAVGGTSIKSWFPGVFDESTKTYPYDNAVVRIQEAKKHGVIKGIIWHQGEADTRDSDVVLYIDRIGKLISNFRSVAKGPDLPFVAGEIGSFRANSKLFNETLNQLAKSVPNTIVISSAGLWHKGDNTHFDSSSASELGNRFAAGMLTLQGKKLPANINIGKQNPCIINKNEIQDGWEVLFDGFRPDIYFKSISSDEFPFGAWAVKDGVLEPLSSTPELSIITRTCYDNFEFSMDYKVLASNIYHVQYWASDFTRKDNGPKTDGFQFQLNNLSDLTNTKASIDNFYAGSLSYIYPSTIKDSFKVGSWNSLRIIANGNEVQHWINDKKVLTYFKNSAEFNDILSKSPFSDDRSFFHETKTGRIILNNKIGVNYRNIKIRRL